MIRIVLAGRDPAKPGFDLQNTVHTGIDIVRVASGAEAIDVSRGQRPDLIIVFPGLPDMSGNALAAGLRSAGADVPVLVLPVGTDIPHGLTSWLEEGPATDDPAARALALALLPESNRVLNKANSRVRHAILNHLTVLLGYLEIISDVKGGDSEGEYLEKMSLAASAVHQCVLLTREYQGIGLSPVYWHDLRAVMSDSASRAEVPISGETEKLPEVLGDPCLPRAFTRILSVMGSAAGNQENVNLEVREMPGGITLAFRSEGGRTFLSRREEVFECMSPEPLRRSVFPAREILAVTGIGISVRGEPADLHIEVDIPEGRFRVQSKESGA
jgi:CheY-like chemotaxis protein